MGKVKDQQSKTMSYILRYHCDKFNLTQDSLGYVDINELLIAVKSRISKVSLEDLIYHTTLDNGRGHKRFELSEDKSKIRACYKYRE